MGTGTTIDEWLASSNTGDVLHDSAVAQANMGQALGDSLKELKLQIEDITARIRRVNQLSDLLRSKRPVSTTSTDTGDLGADKDSILAQMAEFCPNIDTKVALGGKVSQAAIDQWLQALSGASGDMQSESSQVQAQMSSALGHYNGFMENASGTIKKREQLGDSTANNFRSG